MVSVIVTESGGLLYTCNEPTTQRLVVLPPAFGPPAARAAIEYKVLLSVHAESRIRRNLVVAFTRVGCYWDLSAPQRQEPVHKRPTQSSRLAHYGRFNTCT